MKHSQVQFHKQNTESKKAYPCLSVQDALRKQTEQSIYKESTQVRVTPFIAEHKLPFTLATPLINLIKARA